MPDLEQARWRKRITQILVILALFITLLELITYSVFQLSGEFTGAEKFFYIRSRFLYPVLLNFGFLLLNFVIQFRTNIRESLKCDSVILTAILLCTVTAWFHYTLVSALTAFILPVLLSTLFASRKRMLISAAVSLCFMTVCSLRSFSLVPGHVYWRNNIAVSYLLFFASLILSDLMVTYIMEKKENLFSSYQTQLILDQKIKMDPLTNLYNQHTFFDKLNECVNKAEDSDEVFSIAILDIDDFKSINDTYGHSTGNQVLEGLSDMMGLVFSPSREFVARYGGEEFGIIFRNMSQEQAYERIEQLRRHFADNSFSRIGMKRITFSGGIAEYQFGDESISIFNRADAALYEAKKRGKNQTITAGYAKLE